jgi:hypothetical protein
LDAQPRTDPRHATTSPTSSELFEGYKRNAINKNICYLGNTKPWLHVSKMPQTMTFAFLYLLASVPFLCKAASSNFEKRCLAFQPEKLVAGATRNALQYLSSNTTLLLPDNDDTCNRAEQAISANTCRIVLSIKTSEESRIILEAWLPDVWTGRFLATGNGGIDGCECLHSLCRLVNSTLTNVSVTRYQV